MSLLLHEYLFLLRDRRLYAGYVYIDEALFIRLFWLAMRRYHILHYLSLDISALMWHHYRVRCQWLRSDEVRVQFRRDYLPVAAPLVRAYLLLLVLYERSFEPFNRWIYHFIDLARCFSLIMLEFMCELLLVVICCLGGWGWDAIHVRVLRECVFGNIVQNYDREPCFLLKP